LRDTDIFKGNRMQQIKIHLDAVKDRLEQRIQLARTEAINVLKTMQDRTRSMDEYKMLPEVRQADLDKPCQELIDYLGQQSLIAIINDKLRHFEELGYQKLLARMVEMANPKKKEPANVMGTDDGKLGQVKESSVEYIPIRQIRVKFDKAWLATESDVDSYLESMRKALLEEIRKGRRIQI